MISLTPKPVWRGFANRLVGVLNRFAMMAGGLHCFQAGHRQSSHDLRSHCSTPSPSHRSGPSQAGPTLCGWRVDADCASGARICFESLSVAVEFGAITTNQRGSPPCVSRFSCSPFLSFRWRVACRIPPRAASPVLLQGPSWPTRWTKTLSLAQRLAVLPVRPPAVSNWACRPAVRPTDIATDRAAFGRAEPSSRTIRASRLGGPFAFIATGGPPCSRRS